MQSKNGGGGVCSENLNCTIKVVETSQMVINVLFLKDIVLNYTTLYWSTSFVHFTVFQSDRKAYNIGIQTGDAL